MKTTMFVRTGMALALLGAVGIVSGCGGGSGTDERNLGKGAYLQILNNGVQACCGGGANPHDILEVVITDVGTGEQYRERMFIRPSEAELIDVRPGTYSVASAMYDNDTPATRIDGASQTVAEGESATFTVYH